MSAFPTTFMLPPLTWDRPIPSSRKKRADLTVARHAVTRPGQGVLQTGLEKLGTDFASVYRTYRRRVYSQCFCMLHNYQDAEDAAQEVFLQLFRKAHTFRGESSFATWLYRLTTNCVLMEIRRRRHRCPEVLPQNPSVGADTGIPWSLTCT